ncbi:tRNA U-34 5-methylaminomethyl-2-thiouridine biosynthesis protein [Novosphingobium humi]|uniref:tRNA U-34 5-methylaminomethyl-2-thiouridine biosynthesis protein n=1 Tax=Novosphingobium humi TaxID=2282397 RepID=A0ABY7U469_9SPHN|nr:tRNA U-34 5-methylaminomethyl-2-thiouridine biosynthesis protein [Novosphingobium humi]WCT79154.1 tRNA U-34 5-methylaminomethyl-2-thiouridine biosynthesis protein [Novosphingobium humi]
MTVVSAFLLPGNPLPYLRSDNPAWAALHHAGQAAGRALAASNPDVLLIYSTQWMAVLDQLWQTREHSTGIHVDENWYEFGDLQTDLRADAALANACIDAANKAGFRSKAVDYDEFPIDSGTIVAGSYLNPTGKIPAVVMANNLYYSFDETEQLGQLAAEQAELQGKRVAVVGIGGLSGNYFDAKIDIATDRVASDEDDALNRKLLSLLESGDIAALRSWLPEYSKATRADMGMKHLAWVLGATGGFRGAMTLGYGATWGSGAAVVQFEL